MDNLLIRYDKALPNKLMLQVLYVLGVIMAVMGPLIAFALFIWWVRNPFSYHYGDQSAYRFYGLDYAPELFWIAFAILVAGIIFINLFGSIFKKYYRKVYQGKIVYKDTSGGGDYPLNWYVMIEGYTYANELRRYPQYVNAGYWQDAQTGWVVDFTK